MKKRADANTANLKRPQHLSLGDIAYQALLEAIVDQQFAPGAQINIETVARQLNMSNTPVREALMRVTGEGLVMQKSNRGFVVTDTLTASQLKELFDVRYLLEVHALGVGLVTEQVLVEMDTMVERMDQSANGAVYQDFKDYLQADHQFHRIIVGLAANGFLVQVWEDLNVHLHLSRLYTGVGLVDRSDSDKEHRELVAALHSQNREQAVAVLSNHIRGVAARLQAFLASRK